MHADVCSILQYTAMLAAGQQKPIWSPTWNCDLHCSGSYRIEHRGVILLLGTGME